MPSVRSILSSRSRVNRPMAGLVAALVVVVGVYVVTHSQAATEPVGLTLAATPTQVNPGDTVTVAVGENSGTTPVNAVQANLSYDPALLEYVSIDTTGSAFATEAEKTATSGKIRLARSLTGGQAALTGAQSIAKVTFKAKAVGQAVVKQDAESLLASATSNQDILGSTLAQTTVTIGAAQFVLTAAPTTGAVGATVAVKVAVNSGQAPINAVQANLSYPVDKLEFVSISDAGTAFPTAAEGTGGNGTVKIGRSLAGGAANVTGLQTVATANFKIKAAGNATVSQATGSVIAAAATNTDILGGLASVVVTGTDATSSNDSATIALAPSATSVKVGDTVRVKITENSGSATVNAVQVNLTYPAATLEFSSIDTAGTAFDVQAEGAGSNGSVKIGRAVTGGQPAVSGSQTIATVVFTAKATGTAAITMGSDSVVASAKTNLDILTGTATTSVTITAASTPTATPAPTVTVTPVGATPTPTKAPTPTATPVVTANPTATPTAKPFKIGDVNKDGSVDAYDLSILLSNWGKNYADADFDKNGLVNVYDLSILLSHWEG